MADTILEDVTYKTSYIKSGIAFVTYSFGCFVCFQLFIAFGGIYAFFLSFPLLGCILYLRPCIYSLFFPYYLSITKNGIDLSGKKLAWSEINKVRLDSMPTNFIHDYSIFITYGDKPIKTIFEYLKVKKYKNPKIHYPFLKIYSFQLNASAWDIYETLKAFHEAYGKDTKPSIRLESNTVE